MTVSNGIEEIITELKYFVGIVVKTMVIVQNGKMLS